MQQCPVDYFSSEAVIKIWKNNDTKGKNSLFTCLFSEKEAFFRRVIFKNGKVHEDILRVHAETAFLTAWEKFDEACKKETVFTADNIQPFFFRIFKFAYLKLLEKEERARIAVKTFTSTQPLVSINSEENLTDKVFSGRVEKVLEALGDTNCRELLIWRDAMQIDYDEIVRRRDGKINRKSAIKMTSRCRDRFKELWSNIKDN